jgi:hypothetical protein
MKKISYANLKLKINTDTKTVDYNGNTIEVLQYISASDKYDLVHMVLNKSFEEGLFNPVKVDVYFHLGLVYLYSNLNITDKQRENEFDLYDNLASNGILTQILELIPESEYQTLYTYIEEFQKKTLKYRYSAAATLQTFIQDLPKNAEAAKNIVDNFDKEQYKEVIEFARNANGGRKI